MLGYNTIKPNKVVESKEKLVTSAKKRKIEDKSPEHVTEIN